MSDFLAVVERAYESCRKNGDKPWVLEPCEDMIGFFQGVLFADRTDRDIPGDLRGCAYSFRLEIPEDALSGPPRVTFDTQLSHPLIYSGSGHFCFPDNPKMPLSCRYSGLEAIMDALVGYFFLRKRSHYTTDVEAVAVNREVAAGQRRATAPVLGQFWADLKEKGILGGPQTPPADAAPP
jgi:hypothetical protein